MPVKRVHHYHAEATALHARLHHPLKQRITPQGFVKLTDDGGYRSRHAKNYRARGVISFKSSYTHVAGHKSLKDRHGWVTLVTSAIEGLNVLEVVTADRVVGQIATEHPLGGHIPSVTFLGTRFENLRIAGEPVDLELDLNICGAPPAGDQPYLTDPDFLERVGFTKTFPELPDEWEKYIRNRFRGKKPAAAVECSLVRKLKAGSWKTTGNQIEVPDFGKVHLGELRVDCNTFYLNMIRLEMGCIAGGSMSMASNLVNGDTVP
jgi:hypothetical protein